MREFAFFAWFDAVVVSGEEGLAKPDRELESAAQLRARLTELGLLQPPAASAPSLVARG